MRVLLLSVLAAAPVGAATQLPTALWVDATVDTIGDTQLWTNKVEIADLNGDGRYDPLFANGGDYSEPGDPEPNQVFMNAGPGRLFVEQTAEVFGPTPDLARVIKARDLNGDGLTDIVVGTTYQNRSRLYLGTGGGAFREVTSTHLPQQAASIGDLEIGDVDGDGRMDVVQAQGEHPTAVGEKVFLGTGLAPDTAPPSVSLVGVTVAAGKPGRNVRARVHDRKSPLLPGELSEVVVEWSLPNEDGVETTPMRWYGEYLWSSAVPDDIPDGATFRVCATDASGNRACAEPAPPGSSRGVASSLVSDILLRLVPRRVAARGPGGSNEGLPHVH